MAFRSSGTDGQGMHVLRSLGNLCHRRGFLLIVASLPAIALIVGLLPKATSQATVTTNGYSLSPQGQVTSTQVGVCKTSMNHIITAPDVDSARKLRDVIDKGGAYGLYKEDVTIVSSTVIAVSGGGTELHVQTEVEFKCDNFRSADWKKDVRDGAIALLGGVLGGLVQRFVDTFVWVYLNKKNILPPQPGGTDWQRKIAGCIAGIANGATTMVTVALTEGLPKSAVITGYEIGSCLKGLFVTGWTNEQTWTGVIQIAQGLKSFATGLWIHQDVQQVAQQRNIVLDAIMVELERQVRSASEDMMTCPAPSNVRLSMESCGTD
jgi:hypothetical protein